MNASRTPIRSRAVTIGDVAMHELFSDEASLWEAARQLFFNERGGHTRETAAMWNALPIPDRVPFAQRAIQIMRDAAVAEGQSVYPPGPRLDPDSPLLFISG